MKNIKLLAITIPLGIPLIIWRGYVLSVLWRWFVVPLGVPTLGVAHAVGIATTVYLLRKGSKREEIDREYIIRATATSIVAPATALLIGWLAHGWMA